jgi:Cu2+-exporting ATPase
MRKEHIKTTFPVLNMSCAGCASNVRKILQKQQGVQHAEVNFASQTASVEYDRSLTSAKKLQKAVHEAGYELVTVLETETENERLEQAEKRRYHLLKSKTFIALILSAGLIILSMNPLAHWSWAGYVSGVFATFVLFACGHSFFADAYKQVKHRQMNMNTLVALSTATACGFSLFTLLYPQFWVDRGLDVGLYFETAGTLIAFILLGKLLEERAKQKTTASIKKLKGLQPKMATIVLPDGKTEEKYIREIHIDDVIWVKAGEKIPMDGMVTDGHSFVDESMITGEPVPAEKSRGRHVFAGTINRNGSFKFRVTKHKTETLLSQIIRLVNEAQNTKAPIQKIVDKITGVFVPAVIAIALFSAFLWLLSGGENTWVHAFRTFVTVLIVACPCALGLATPTAIMVGMGKGAEQGILIKDMDSLETLRKVNDIVLDKTGTVTKGVPKVTDFKWMVAETEELRNILFNMEKASGHPLAKAITDVISGTGMPLLPSLEILPGKGVKTSEAGASFYVGNFRLFPAAGNTNEALEWANGKENEGNSIVLFGTDTQIMALFALSDEIKESSQPAVGQLHALGIEVTMATGDNEISGAVIARQAGIKELLVQAMPEDKLRLIKKKQQAGKTVAMVGDGINDSAALAQADVSIAMGKGSEIAIETAAVTIVSGDLRKIADAIRLSRNTVTVIRQNLFWAFIYNLIAIPIAAGVLYPVNGFLLNPMIAGAAMAFSSVSVVLNSLRFNGFIFRKNK